MCQYHSVNWFILIITIVSFIVTISFIIIISVTLTTINGIIVIVVTVRLNRVFSRGIIIYILVREG